MRAMLATTLFLLAAGAPPARARAPAVGLVTKLSGPVSWTSGAGEPSAARAFMKVRAGDRFDLRAGGKVRVVWFAGGRQETWRGPVVFEVGEAAGQARRPAGASPEVGNVPGKASTSLRRVPVLLKRIGSSRAGGVQVRAGGAAEPREVVPLAPDEQAELQAARDLAAKLRTGGAPDDVTADLFLLSHLADFEQYAEMAEVLKAARTRQPGNEELERLEEWARGRLAPAP